MAAPPKVSVCFITYNHDRYVAQALDSILIQQAPFSVEVVVGEDCSTDRTAEIVHNYASRYPDRIRLLPTSGNLGMMRNVMRTLAACSGEYLALLEGDDYWTDPYKLAKQVAFLDEHPEHTGCAHVVGQLGEQADYGLFPNPCPVDVTFDQLLAENRFATCSVVYRRRFMSLPEWFQDCAMGDWPLHLLHAAHGPFRVFSEVMGVYRIHERGMWSSANRVSRLRNTISLYRHLLTAFPDHTVKLLRCRFRWQYELTHDLATRDEWPEARRLLRELLATLPDAGLGELAQFLDISLRVLCPLPSWALPSLPTIGYDLAESPTTARARAEHLAARAVARAKPRFARLPAVARELATGRYTSFGLGPLGTYSAAADLLL